MGDLFILCAMSGLLAIASMFFVVMVVGWCVEGWTPGDGIGIALFLAVALGFYFAHLRVQERMQRYDPASGTESSSEVGGEVGVDFSRFGNEVK